MFPPIFRFSFLCYSMIVRCVYLLNAFEHNTFSFHFFFNIQRYTGRCSKYVLLDSFDIHGSGCIYEKTGFRSAFSGNRQFTKQRKSDNKAHEILSMGCVYIVFPGKLISFTILYIIILLRILFEVKSESFACTQCICGHKKLAELVVFCFYRYT